MIRARKLILAYHSLHKADHTDRDSQEYVSAAQSLPVGQFEEQLCWLAGFAEFVPLDEIVRPASPDHWQVAVTFDDGYRNNIELGLPFFQRYQVPVTWFVCTRYVENPNRLPWWDLLDFVVRHSRSTVDVTGPRGNQTYDLGLHAERVQFQRTMREAFLNGSLEMREELYMQIASFCAKIGEIPGNAFADKELVQHIADSNWITLGGHTVSHPNLATEKSDTVENELTQGRCLLQSWTGQPVHWFAYPHGRKEHYNDDVRRCVKECGFRGAVTTTRGYVSDTPNRFEVPRFMVPTYGGMVSFKAGVLALNQVDWFMQNAGRGVHWLRNIVNSP